MLKCCVIAALTMARALACERASLAGKNPAPPTEREKGQTPPRRLSTGGDREDNMLTFP